MSTLHHIRGMETMITLQDKYSIKIITASQIRDLNKEHKVRIPSLIITNIQKALEEIN